jgi:hypothetical protein
MSNTIITYKDFNPELIDFDAPEEKRAGASQLMSYTKYNGSTFAPGIQFPFIHLETYGIPSKDSKFHDTPEKRMHIRTPLRIEYLNQNDLEHVEQIDNINKLVEKLKQLDTKLSSDEYKEKLFGKKKDKYTYEPCFRSPQEQDDDDEEEDNKNKKKSNLPILNYMKIKIDSNFESKQIKSTVFESKFDTEQNKEVRIKKDIETIDDFANIVRWRSDIRMVVKPSHLWAQPSKIKDPKYGIIFKLVKIEVKRNDNGGSGIDYEQDDFIDDDIKNINTEKSLTLEKLSITDNNKNEDEDEDDDEDEDEDEDDKPIEIDTKSKTVEIDSDSDDEVVVKSKVDNKKSKTVEIDSDSDDEVVVKSKVDNKKSKTVEIDSDSDDEVVIKSKVVEKIEEPVEDVKVKKGGKKAKK